MKTATFCGYCSIDYYSQIKIKTNLKGVIAYLIKRDICNFLVGGYGIFNAICIQILEEAKKDYPHINIFLNIPHTDHYDIWSYEEYCLYNNSDVSMIPDELIEKCNKNMVDQSDIVVSSCTMSETGKKMYDYALMNKKEILKLFTTI